jgi:hypothetical protein
MNATPAFGRRLGAACLLSVCAVSAGLGQFHFSDAGLATGTVVVCNTHGSGFIDYNNDGWDDVFVVHNTSEGNWVDLPHTLLRNRQNLGKFVNVTDSAGVAGYLTPSAQGFAAADYDNDGWTDMVIGMGTTVNKALCYHNNRDGTFSHANSGVDDQIYSFHGRCLSFLDYNNDGWLDLFVVRDTYPDGGDNPLLFLYRNNGSGYFLYRNGGWSGYTPTGSDLYGFAVADLTADNYPDIFLPRFESNSLLFINNRNDTWTENASGWGIASGNYTGALFFDYDNDLDWDLFIRAMNAPARLYRNNGNHTFTNVATAAGVDSVVSFRTNTCFGGGLSAADFDNDGDQDLLILTKWGMNLLVFRNNGNGTFTECSLASGLRQDYHFYWSSPIGDYDRDGYLDIYMAKGPELIAEKSAVMYHNDGGSNHWIQFKLTGVASNRSAVGTRLILYTADGKRQMRQVLGGSGYKTDSYWVHFGLGVNASVDSLVLYWPSGTVQRWIGLMADQFMNITEENSTRYGVVAVRGNAVHTQSGRAVSQVAVKLTGSLTQTDYTDITGGYEFFPISYGVANLTVTPSKARHEDVGSGVISAYDASLVMQRCAGLDTLTAKQRQAADADSSLDITPLDAAFIARYAVGKKNDAASKAGRWRFSPARYVYALMNQGFVDQDFSCWVTGDVSGNWGSTTGSEKAGSGRPVAPSRIAAPAGGGEVEIPLTVEAGSGLLAADIWFRVEGSGLVPEGVETTDLTQAFETEWNGSGDGLWKVALYGAEPVEAAGAFCRLKFRLEAGATGVVSWERLALNERETRIPETVVGVSDRPGAPAERFGLGCNYPNPFNPSTAVTYRLDRPGDAGLVVFDVRGRRVRELVRGWRPAGEYRAEWDGRDGSGLEAAAGVYIGRLESAGRVKTIKMIKAD